MEKKITQDQIKKLVLQLHKQGLSPEKIGLVLRDTYGIAKAKLYGKKITQILKEEGVEIDPDIENLEKKSEKLKKHLEKNKHDYRTGRALIIKQAKLRKIKKYRGIEKKK